MGLFGSHTFRCLTLSVVCLFHATIVHAVDFNREIRPILSNHCFQCHGPDEHERQADLRLDIESPGALEDGVDSEFFRRILSDDPDEVMPPPDVHKPLLPEQIELLKDWLAEGAPYEMHWAYKPLARPAVPRVDNQPPANPIDGFVLQRLKDQELTSCLLYTSDAADE